MNRTAEYALLFLLVVAVVLYASAAIGGAIGGAFEDAATSIDEAGDMPVAP